MDIYFRRKRAAVGELIYAGLMAGMAAGIVGVLLILLRADGERTWHPFARTALGFFGKTATAGVYAGLLSGLIAGTIMALFLMIASASREEGMIAPLRLIAATVYRDRALKGPSRFPVVMTGTMIHFATALFLGLVWGFIWAVFLGRRAAFAAPFGGAVYGLIIWAIQSYAVLPLINRPLVRGIDPGLFAVAHLLFGATLGTYPFFYGEGLFSAAYVPAVLVGVFSLFAVTETAGVIFALAGGDWTIGKAVRWGGLYGILLWLVIHGVIYAVNPALGRALQSLRFAVWNLFIGIVLGIYPAFLEPRPAEAIRREEWRRAA